MYDPDVELERRAFRQLIAVNPNHFGTAIGEVELPVIKKVQSSTKYEEIGCVGYDPVRDRLDAVVYVTQSTGYGGGLCSRGTPEYVRFYLSFDDGTTWEDKGAVAFRAYNIPEGTAGRKRLEYAVSLPIDPLNRFCTQTRTVLCRAILSWNFEPPPNTPGFTPVWGEVHDTHLLTEPYRFVIPFPDLVEELGLDLPSDLLDLDDQAPIKLKASKPLPFGELASLSKKSGVQPMRFAFPAIKKQAMLADASALSLTEKDPELPSPSVDLGDLDLSDLIVQIDEAEQGEGDGNTSFEELECVGLFPNENMLVGTVRLKRPTGFNGGPCTGGSRQYVAFWADIDKDGDFDSEGPWGLPIPEYLGTVSFPVYDVADFPDAGLEYAVTLPVDFARYQRPCEDGPVLIRIRAILAWEDELEADDFDKTPVWGNRVETTVHVKPGPAPGDADGLLAIVGGVATSEIDADGLTVPGATFALNGGTIDATRRCPFGGVVTIQGYGWTYASYALSVKEEGASSWMPITGDFEVVNAYGVKTTHSAGTDGRYAYLPHSQNVGGLLGRWYSGGDAKWEVRIEAFDSAGTKQAEQVLSIQLDNTWPEADVEITSGAGNCGKFGASDPIAGTFLARDDYFGSYTLEITPNKGGVQLSSGGSSPTATLTGTTPTPASGSTWDLDASNMPSCGYNVRLTVTDRAVVNSATVGHKRTSVEGFCVL